ncbi:hypothetical protein OsI_17174 [Oryza sativa Indica Group]|uniref:RRM domain-containing protein n=1 Tax=Oryza sativa subsp. indica TaxID=39946 RepID=B8ATF1_ORYSI|nr:hypothetical protein OsI_17174 [Oryza sativa Indica Group]
MVKGEACMICKNDANETLHLRNICFDWTKDDLAEELKTYKLENLEDINLVEDPERKGKNRGYAFLDFRTNVDGVDAFFKLQNRDIYLGTDVRAQVSFSKTLSQDDKIMEKVKSVFLDGLPPHWDEDKVREVFGKFGEIDSIHLARNMFKAKRKDFGFIGFTSRQSALDCISTVSKGGIVEGSGKGRKLMASSSPGMCNCGECYVEQDAAPASSQVVPLRHQLAKPFHERSSEPDDHSASAYEAAEYKERKSRYHPSSRDGPSNTHHRNYRRQGR